MSLNKAPCYPLKIAVNTRLLLKNKLEGIGWFIFETLKRITQQHPEHEFFFIFDRKYDKDFLFSDNVTPLVLPPQARHPILHYLWFEQSIPILLKKIKPDLFLTPDAYCSLNTKTKTLIVIHDLNFEHYPEHMPWLNRRYYRYYTPKFAERADRIATVSNFSKNDIVKQYHINPEKIDVIYNGANESYKPIGEEEKVILKRENTHGRDFFIFIGALNPRKNLTNLFKAFDLFKKQTKSDYKLVVVGEKMYWPKNIKITYENMEYSDDVIFTGRLGVEKLSKMIATAKALTFASYFEGFGIPIIEAFKAETPVITSNVSSMPEIAGDAAILTDPFNPEDIATAMKAIATDENLRAELIKKGRQRVKMFSWDNTAENLWKSMLKTIEAQ